MLTIYRRHSSDCVHKADGRKWKRCKCPIWTDGSLNGNELRTSLEKVGCQTWEQAQAKVREWETGGSTEIVSFGGTTIPESITRFIAGAEARKLAKRTIQGYTYFLHHVQEFCTTKGIARTSQLTFDLIDEFRNSWKCQATTAMLWTVMLRFYLKFCLKRKWVAENYAKELDPIRVNQVPTMPYTVQEVRAILDDLGTLKNCERPRQSTKLRAERLRLLCLVMRYTGLRVSDAIELSPDRIQDDGRVFLYMAKTSEPVFCALPDFVVDQLSQCPKAAVNRYFWTGAGEKLFQIECYRTLFKRAVTVPKAGFHRFRDTFAVELLMGDVPMERVSKLLGHRSIKTTEKHYDPWVAGRQKQLDADVRRVLHGDPLAQSEIAKGQKLVRVK